MLHIELPIIVEGKYDLIKLSNITDAVLLPTNGFQIFKDKEKAAFIKKLAGEKGVIVLTDSDSAGNIIRSYLNNILGPNLVHHVFVPPILGKERRKTKPSAEGILGVEGLADEILINALQRFVCTPASLPPEQQITPAVLMELRLTGCPGSAALRKQVLATLQLPNSISPATLIKVLNRLTTKEKLREMVGKMQEIGPPKAKP